jgi:carbonic anhydrase/acetyltransferase-like protein (isoleucine patch superfamily)
MRRLVLIAIMRAVALWDRLRLRWLRWLHPGLEVHRSASSALACARFSLGPGARLVIGPGVVTERNPRALSFELGAGAEVEIGEGTWLRTSLGPVNVVAFEGARIQLAPECFLNGCHVSAKRSVTLGRRTWIGPGSRVFDADQHDFDAARLERSAPVAIGDCVWVAGDVTVLRGVTIGEHSVVGTRSVVTRDVPPHTLAYGVPAEPRGEIGDRSRTR